MRRTIRCTCARSYAGLLLLTTVLALAACSDDDPMLAVDGYQLGTPSGSVWDEIDGELALATFEAQTDNGVWIAADAVAALTDDQKAALAVIWASGYPIATMSRSRRSPSTPSTMTGTRAVWPTRPS